MDEKPIHWVGTSKMGLLRLPAEVVHDIGYALHVVQNGGHPPTARVWKGLGPGIYELAEYDACGTFHLVYSLQLARAVYVLHVFQKKSPSGIRTSRNDIGLIRRRLSAALADYEVRYGGK